MSTSTEGPEAKPKGPTQGGILAAPWRVGTTEKMGWKAFSPQLRCLIDLCLTSRREDKRSLKNLNPRLLPLGYNFRLPAWSRNTQPEKLTYNHWLWAKRGWKSRAKTPMTHAPDNYHRKISPTKLIHYNSTLNKRIPAPRTRNRKI